MNPRSSVFQVGSQYATGLEYQSKSLVIYIDSLVCKVEFLRTLVGGYDTNGGG